MNRFSKQKNTTRTVCSSLNDLQQENISIRDEDFRKRHCIRHGERSGQSRKTCAAQAVVLSLWHNVQGFGTAYFSVMAGVMNANVCARTFTSATVVATFGI